MNRKLVLLLGLIMAATPLFAGPRDDQWKEVQEAIKKGLPKSAITNLEPIIQGALRDKAYAEAVKAIAEKIALEGNIQGNKPEEKITRLEAEIAKAPGEMKPILEAVLAHWYWQYFQQNRWRFMQRTATAEPSGKDFTTWDLPRLFAEIDRHFEAALSAGQFLKATPVSAWDDLLERGTMPDSYRPTLYDFIAYEALGFYASGEQAGAKPEDAFELGADSPALGGAERFLAWQPAAEGDTNSPVWKAIGLYQALLRFHQGDPPPRLAFGEADLERLNWAWNTAVGEAKDERYRAALEDFIRAYADYDISALAMEREARLVQQQGDLAAAHKLAQRGADLFPSAPGGKLCANLVQEIEAKSVTISTERVWNAPWPKIEVRYRNLGAVYFRAIPYDWEALVQKRQNPPETLSYEERRQILSQTPVLEWSEQLPPTPDYQEHTQSWPAPDSLKPGYYFIAASCNPGFGENDNQVSMTAVWVSNLALITGTRPGEITGFVLHANSGEPIQGAEIAVWHLDNRGNRVADPPLGSDADGRFSLKVDARHAYLLRARYQGEALATPGDYWAYNYQPEPPPRAQTVFFTDRGIYRPGQIIQYKGIALRVDQARNNYEVLKGEEVTVVFRDVNGKEIARQQQRANEYGSFAGSFTAPRDRLMGVMSLQVEGRAQGGTRFRVEEYKRPKFEVTLEAPQTAAKLNEPVRLGGHAMSYTGAAIDGAPVKYRVVREVRMPWWWGWWGGGYPGQQEQEIAHGTSKSATDGSFEIEFTAKPDPGIPEKNEPTFVFHIDADVTDNTGETRSAERNIRIGYTALEAEMTAGDWQTSDQPIEVKVTTKTLDGEPQAAEGSVKIYDLQSPPAVERSPLPDSQPWRYRAFRKGAGSAPGRPPDRSDPNNWPLGKVVAESGFTTDTNGVAKLSFKLPAGAYRALLETQDRFGKKVTGRLPVQVLNPAAGHLGIKIPHLLAAPQWQVQPGDEFLALWGSGYPTGRAFVEIEYGNKIIQSYWTGPGQTQHEIKVPVTEEMRGGFTLQITQVRENRAYLDSRTVEVPWKNKELELKWEHFVSKLKPGQKETWTAIISGPSSEKTAAEMVAALYDESLDAFAPPTWIHRFNVFRQESSSLTRLQFGNIPAGFQPVFGNFDRQYQAVQITYRSFPPDLVQNAWGYEFSRTRYGLVKDMALSDRLLMARGRPGAAPMAAMTEEAVDQTFDADSAAGFGGAAELKIAQEPNLPPKINLGQVAARKNLNETAFFFPQLTSDSNGIVRMTFTMPEALTRWHFLGFAHDQQLRSGFLEDHAVTAKDLMVQPNPPRFLREGDTIEFTVKVSNQSGQPQAGKVRLTFNLAATDQPADQLLGNTHPEQDFQIPGAESRGFSWRIHVPDGCGFLTYKAVGATATVSDGEEGAIPVLSRRILVRESLPLPIRGPATRKFEFTKLLKSGSSKTLQNESLTVQMASNPAWYAVLALPYLMEYPYECSEQVFNRLYANALARNIANSDPRIHRIFEQWRNTPALQSPLEKNQDLKSVALEETPWVRQAESETQARKNVGILFDDNRLNTETDAALQKLTQMQHTDGAWPWFPGGYANDYITLYITTGFGRLRHLGVDISVAPALKSLRRLDAWMTEHYQDIQRGPHPEEYVPSPTDALYLYGRSFFLKDLAIPAEPKTAVEFFLKQSRQFWLQTNNRQTQGHLAIALHRFGGDENLAIARGIMTSLKQRSVSNEELGMFWRDTEYSWWWYRAPIETQALMIEAFDEVMHDAPAVEDCKVWLLKQKQTQDWKTTKATADAVYALLLQGKDVLSSDALVQVKLDGLDITPKVGAASPLQGDHLQPPVEPGTGFYEVRFVRGEIKPKYGEITVKKTDPGVAWGGIHWQYLEDMSKVTPHEGTPLKLKKALFVKRTTSRGPVLEPLKGGVQVGDELVVRIELRTDRDMEYVHMKDQRGSGTEPVNVLSRYQYQDGLAYYESTRDTASHFFIDYLPKGTYVFEYSTRVQLKGEYQTGVAEIQCMYAPEFNSHSEGFVLDVK